MSTGITGDDSQADQATVKENLVFAFKTNLLETLKKELHELNDDDVASAVDDKQFKRWAIPWWEQFSVLLKRGLKQRKYESFSGLKVAQVLVVAFLTGALWWKSDDLQDQVVHYYLILFSCSNQEYNA